MNQLTFPAAARQSRWKYFMSQFISALFIYLFAYTGINKFIEIDTFSKTIKDYPFIGKYAAFVAWWLPFIEISIAIWLLIPITRLLGLYSSFLLMLLFTLYVAYMIFFTDLNFCTCGGMLQEL